MSLVEIFEHYPPIIECIFDNLKGKNDEYKIKYAYILSLTHKSMTKYFSNLLYKYEHDNTILLFYAEDTLTGIIKQTAKCKEYCLFVIHLNKFKLKDVIEMVLLFGDVIQYDIIVEKYGYEKIQSEKINYNLCMINNKYDIWRVLINNKYIKIDIIEHLIHFIDKQYQLGPFNDSLIKENIYEIYFRAVINQLDKVMEIILKTDIFDFNEFKKRYQLHEKLAIYKNFDILQDIELFRMSMVD